jgi:hypothetical protein
MEINLNIKDRNRIRYILEMRKSFSNKKSIHPNGELNHKYLQTKVGQYWSFDENNNLIRGIEELGVGSWDEIKKKYLQTWSKTEIKLRSCLLLKCFNLDEYKEKKMSIDEILFIAEKNKNLGIELNKFKHGIYYN